MAEGQNFDELFDLMQKAINLAKDYPAFAGEADQLEARLYETHDMLLNEIVTVGADNDKLAQTPGLQAFNRTYLDVIALGERVERSLRGKFP